MSFSQPPQDQDLNHGTRIASLFSQPRPQADPGRYGTRQETSNATASRGDNRFSRHVTDELHNAGRPRMRNRRETSDNNMFFRESTDSGYQSDGEETDVRTPDDTNSELLTNSNDTSTSTTIRTCPINTQCPKRTNNQLDCRPLIPPSQYKKLEINPDEECHRLHATPPNPGMAPQATSVRLAALIVRLDKFHQLPALNPSHLSNNQKICDWIEEMTRSKPTAKTLKESQVLQAIEKFISPSTAATRNVKRFPVFIIEELTILHRKWSRGDYECYSKRGLIVRADKFFLDKTWSHYRPANYFGPGELVNGQIWYSRAELMRDGVHSAPVHGICGTVEGGAYSVVLTRKYANTDNGDIVDYLGTALRDDLERDGKGSNIKDPEMNTREFDTSKTPTDCTRMLMTSLKTKQPVRLIRSCELADIIEHKPKIGFRFDGMYKVISMTPMKEDLQIYSFRLKRVAGQGPLRDQKRNLLQAKQEMKNRRIRRREGWTR